MASTENHTVVHEANGVPFRATPKEFFERQPSSGGHLKDIDHYRELYEKSINDPQGFFGPLAKEMLSWDRDFHTIKSGTLKEGNAAWFLGGQLNASYNCVDRHALKNPNKPALIYEADEDSDSYIITYGELLKEVSRVAGVLQSWGVGNGDTVAVYLPMNAQAIIAMLAITRLGAAHSVIFAGFSSGSIKDRVNDAQCKALITCDEGKRGGRVTNIKRLCDDALESCPSVKHVLVHKRTNNKEIAMKEGRDFYWDEETVKFPGYLPPVSVDSEDPLFLLYTSGSTGTPKGVVHTTAGFLLGAALTTKYVFDVHEEDILFTAGDVGWITGHTYALYGPLLLGIPSIIFEGTPAYPDYGRFWHIVQKHRATHFYVAPTALRLLRKAGQEEIKKYDISSLRTLGSVGEPISPDIWEWYNEYVGKDQCHISDTYWQTESGSHLIAPLAGITPNKPGSASYPFFGIETALIDPVSGAEIKGNDVEGVLVVKDHWPSMARTVYHNHTKYMDTYMNPYPGYYFTGDGAARDHDGYYWIRGRVDDVVNVSGHRLSTAEIEAALIEDQKVGEAAVVGINDDITGQAVIAYVALKDSNTEQTEEDLLTLRKELVLIVRKSIGPFAAPKAVIVVADLPKTRSGKIMRRILRKISSNEADQLGDITTLQNPQSVEGIVKSFAAQYGKK
ncbi:acetyl-coenzyme A synthetase 2 [Lodderomyces elongisporus]|uniref:Acetyl-coenzyme A synthetase n=1 Tax=Lodderomyces elongisporus (strain ATCC 11503 / CBS 2605 / JCM 1781 / NBRC 1676 / NRRL YB-4239) TaxID=379508 RepID=A5DWD1_LODEL|nr:acetyl-coenzyme A synthetase 2 [Lodderomyces elongisporus]EDK43489.1 acetyl-coenzyme A synthetase 2 [Lodderomyces elongisporus NRRL YB-4239]WLF77918.1 acetyl-coenzyme A synthetase 2 [Lodderomyces elongisporus]